ncbi:MAG: hypothetical protein P9L91_03855, partial [Candidatus Zophobacter franzmannii]|nr:hypothetical protein [Candidatus Zophobacter franzmannii]
MALRKRLLVALVIITVAVSVFAQEAPVFVPATPVSDLIIVVEDEGFEFPDPPNIRAIYTIQADSTVTYVEILTEEYKERQDWKDEMMMWKFHPAMMDSVLTQSNEYFDVTLISKKDFQKILEKVQFKPSEIKEQIIEYAVRHKQSFNRNLSELSPSVYASNLHFASPSTGDMYLTDADFSILSGPTTGLHQYKSLRGISQLSRQGLFYDLAQEYYPYQPALTTIYAGIGENDHNIANIGFMKNNSIGVKNLLIRADMHFEYGYWGNSVETSGNSQVSADYRSKIGTFKFDYRSISQEVPSHYILPAYNVGVFSSASEKSESITAGYSYKFFQLGYRSTTSSLKADIINGANFKLKSDSKQYLAGLQHNSELLKLKLNYEFIDRDVNFDTQELYQDNPNSKHIISFNGDSDWSFLKLNERVIYKHTPQLYVTQTDVAVPIGEIFSFKANFMLSDRDEAVSGSGTESDSLNYRDYFDDFTEAFTKQSYGGGFEVEYGKLQLSSLVGIKTTSNLQQTVLGLNETVINPEETGLFGEGSFSAQVTQFGWNFGLNGSLVYQSPIDELQYYPEWQTRVNFEAIKPMKPDNAFKTGFTAVYVSEYNTEIGIVPEYLVTDW